MLTDRAWQTRFGGDPEVLGQVVRIGPASLTVIGVTPEAFTGAFGVVPVELFVLATEGALVEPGWAGLLTARLPERFVLTGRLRPGATVAEAAAQLDLLAAALAAEHPDASRHSELYIVAERHARPEPSASRHARPLMSVVMGLAALVLLVAVANVSGPSWSAAASCGGRRWPCAPVWARPDAGSCGSCSRRACCSR